VLVVQINQWVPAAHRGDGVGDSARRVRDLLRRMGHLSELYALAIDDDLVGDVRRYGEEGTCDGDVTILHFALSSEMTEAFAALPRGRVLQYHNITPARFFVSYDAGLFRLAALGRQELAALVGHVELALGTSEFNRRELEALGFHPTGVMPLAIDTEWIARAPRRPALEALLDDGLTNFLFVGRIAPNKRIEDHLWLAEHYRRYVSLDGRFIFVGRHDVVPRYYATLRAFIARFDMPRDRVVFTGPVPSEDLAAYYRTCSVYVSLSEHEGFCAPLVEAMASDVPVLAYAAAAVPETLGGAGVQFRPKDLERAAELLGVLAFDEEVRGAVIARQRRRLPDFGDAVIERHLRTLVDRAGQGW